MAKAVIRTIVSKEKSAKKGFYQFILAAAGFIVLVILLSNHLS